MLPTQRRQRILEDINRTGAGTVAGLSEKYGVSETTIRRDLKLLEDDGHVRRTHGGAVSEQRENDTSTIVAREKRKRLYAEQKRQIARYVAQQLIEDGDIIMLGGGTTVNAIVPWLADKSDLTVVTNGLAIAGDLHHTLRQHGDATIICSGGILRSVSSTFVGPVAERFFHEFHVNKLFLSATGLTLDTGVTDPSMLETQVKKAMIASASEVVIIMDSSKFTVKSLLTVLNVEDIDVLVTDEGITSEMKAAIEAWGVDVHVAPAEKES